MVSHILYKQPIAGSPSGTRLAIVRAVTGSTRNPVNIEKVFLMVSVQESDRDVLRFLWFDDVHSENCKMICLRFTRAVFGVSCIPFLLNATLQHHYSKYVTLHPKMVNKLTAASPKDEEESYQLYLESKSVLREGGVI